MKKNYEHPEMKIYVLKKKPSLLVGSGDPEEQGTGGDQNGQGI